VKSGHNAVLVGPNRRQNDDSQKRRPARAQPRSHCALRNRQRHAGRARYPGVSFCAGSPAAPLHRPTPPLRRRSRLCATRRCVSAGTAQVPPRPSQRSREAEGRLSAGNAREAGKQP
jgi:hypothetical protein